MAGWLTRKENVVKDYEIVTEFGKVRQKLLVLGIEVISSQLDFRLVPIANHLKIEEMYCDTIGELKAILRYRENIERAK